MRERHERTDEDLLRAMIAGDNAAFVELYGRFHPKLERYARRQLGTSDPAGHVSEDLLQDLWLRVIDLRAKPPRGLRGDNADGEPFYVQAFLFRIAHNLIVDHVRASRPADALETSIEEAQLTNVANGVAEPSDAEEIVQRALATLPLEFREVLELNLHLGYRFDEIAGMLDKSPEAIWARASRARARLRRAVLEIAEREGVSLKDYLPKRAHESAQLVTKNEE
jgi:RNA polymerase sigma-70 factor (ECF subfamily)